MTQTTTLSIRNLFPSIVLLALFAVSGPSTILANEADCSRAVPVDLNSSLRGHGIDKDAAEMFSVELPVAGILMIDVSALAGSDELPRLGLLKDRCEGGVRKSFDLAVIERSAARLIVAARKGGSYFFRIGSQDKRRSLSAYRLSTGFVSLEDANLDPRLFMTKTEEEDDTEPDPVTQPMTFDPDGPVVTTKTEEEDDTEPDPVTQTITFDSDGPVVTTKTEEEDDTEPDPVTQPLPFTNPFPGSDQAFADQQVRFAIDSLCGRITADDHGDTLNCATSLFVNQTLVGRIDNDWGDDDDLFALTLREVATIQVETTGTTDVLGELYTASGDRLAVDGDGGDEGNIRMVRTLTPGRYFVRVSGAEYEEGSYSLTIRTLDW